MDDEKVEELLGELGPLNKSIQLVQRGSAPSSWDIFLGDESDGEIMSVGVSHQSQDRKLVLFSSLAVPDAENEAPTYEMLLTFNGLWTETGGQRMALDGDGLPMLVMDLSLPGLDASALAAQLEAFATRAMSWQVLLEQGGFDAGQAPGTDDPAEASNQEHVLRV
ncbi:MAG: type III secretion system chaperone [Pseudomonadota bacterium]